MAAAQQDLEPHKSTLILVPPEEQLRCFNTWPREPREDVQGLPHVFVFTGFSRS
ncbi:hypothetical protein JOB18_025089 [Solea senegalensis]|uniref:Uncharacterized protein n=1 Tax=Solea senegalensis TaxID=28829 RepID=A0AAV6SKV7_SOLSE|nr:hypothetical protein JOB18_025089 [Solea senegalensis]